MRSCQPLSLAPSLLALEQNFGRRLIGVIGYGSYFGACSSSARDIDLVVALDCFAETDLGAIKAALDKRDVKLPVQVQILYIEGGGNPDLYSINTCGPFFLEVLRGATVLTGTNPVRRWPKPRREVTDLSLLQKMQQYVYELQNRYLNHKGTALSSDDWRLAKKRLRLLDDDAARLLGPSWVRAKEGRALRAFLRENPEREGRQIKPIRLERALTLCQSALKLARDAVYNRLADS